MYISKNSGRKVRAWELGTNSYMERKLINSGQIAGISETNYLLSSNGDARAEAEIAHVGDFFEIDEEGRPFPIEREWFKKNHRQIEGDLYEQIEPKRLAWEASEGITPEIKFLIEKKGVIIRPEDPDYFFEIQVFGGAIVCPADLVIIFYDVARNPEGQIEDVWFHVVSREEFEENYHYSD